MISDEDNKRTTVDERDSFLVELNKLMNIMLSIDE